jgi:serine/threonine protein kinase
MPYSKTETVRHPREELTIGSTFAGRYQIIEELGKGGMGNVYKVLDKELGEKVALKLLKPEIAADNNIIERFRNELKFARKITHKNVCRMYDLSKAEMTPYITMEYVSGEDLKSTLRRVGPLSTGKVVYIAKQVCEGLLEAHKLGVVHRDLKPQNIMIDKKGHAHIMDFGIARSMKSKGVTTSGMMIGTPEYMSPEQVEGKPVDVRADIYAMGVILYEMTTGTTPFTGDTAISVAIKHTREKPRNPREINVQIPLELSRLILQCLEKDRGKRPQSVEELMEELNKIERRFPTTDRVIPDKPSTSREFTARFVPKKIFLTALIIIGAVTIVLAAWQFTPLPDIFKKSPAPPPEHQVEDAMNAASQFWKNKEYSKAYNQYKKALEIEPSHFEAQFGLANALKAQEKFDEAIPEYEKAIALDNTDQRPYGQLGLIYEQRQKPDKALQYYKKYLEIAPQGQEFNVVAQKVKYLEDKIQTAAEKPKEPAEQSAAKQTKPKKPKVRPEEKTSPKPEPAEPEKKKPDVSGNLDRGIQAFNREDYQECIKQMEEVLKVEPHNSSAQFFMAEAKKRISDRIKEQEISSKLETAQDAFRKGNYQECIQQAEEVLQLAPGNVAAQTLLTEAKKKIEERRIEQQINDGLRRARDAFQNREYQECISQANRVLELDADNGEARRLLSQARINYAQQQAIALVNQYVQAVNSKNLVAFYERVCSPQLFNSLKKRTELSMRSFESFQSSASGTGLQFKGTNTAEISFSHVIKATTRDGVQQDVFEGTIQWEITRQGETWKITKITSNPKGKK